MSTNNTKSSSADESTKQANDDCNVDSGFLSGYIESGVPSSSDIDRAPVSERSEIDDKQANADSMYIDSGICQNFSTLQIDEANPKFNDLSSKSRSVDCQEWYGQDEDGNTFLHFTISESFIEGAHTLVRAAPFAALLDTPNDDGIAPIHLAALMKQAAVVRWLVVAGAKPMPRTPTGESPLHIAARAGDYDTCRALIEPVKDDQRRSLALRYQPVNQHVDLNQWNYEGQTCVHVAAIGNHVEVLRLLVYYGADINAREGTAGFTALHYAIRCGHNDLVEFLLRECKKIDVRAVTYGGRGALQLGFSTSQGVDALLRSQGAALPYASDEEEEEEEDEYSESDTEMERSSQLFNVQTMVNASA